MIAITAQLRADPGREAVVEKALREMVDEARRRYPTLPGYSVLVAEDDPRQFMVYLELTSVEVRLPEHEAEQLMLLGTGLREVLSDPTEIRRYNLIAEADPVKGPIG